MAGRSGAAALEIEFREAARSFQDNLPALILHLQSNHSAIAASLARAARAGAPPPTLERWPHQPRARCPPLARFSAYFQYRREDELYLAYSTAVAAAHVERTDVSTAFGSLLPPRVGPPLSWR